ncbi:Ectoine hydroxylase-related dioxygenase, phytanoyl-CoA dioxygenase (PhyH) family [Cognatiyoonia koreensis]|uniref:Ectoine hydroxylase-related dioxygenase, phytanoyl-CoA dioxygenase (PhyH) family n=1 Tax=Cognatiyoonia koreensis TaxID=364200 RepID=A0A1I0QY22_9RHOB|nr:phytanoyl-CoA dioxygenase family protein [Cognatiyoonia koreensis]SEW32450.1 Ectoine hydroxylase-related dioxygenase, phytanoyl-CoA dioxygenase (PhyH) family [Cognatiyoonia koreensis]
MLSADQKAAYDKDGYLVLDGFISGEQLTRMQAATDRLIDASRNVSESDEIYDLDKGHGPDNPRLTRIKLPHKRDQIFEDVLKRSALTEVLTDLLGPDTTLITSKLNTKAPGGGAAVEWHQDWAFYPHTNDDLLAFGVLLEDVDLDNGPLMVIPGTHKGPILSHHTSGVFSGAIDPDDPLFTLEKAVTLTGKAGTVTVHHARILHGSAPNKSDRARKILFFECAAGDAWPILGASSYIHALGQRLFWDDLQDRQITGSPCLAPRLALVPVTMPLPPAPDNSSIFRMQQSGGAKSAFK